MFGCYSNNNNTVNRPGDMKDKIRFQLVISALLVIVGCGLLIAGFCVPPIGIIDSSILIAFGEILTFVGTIFGIERSYKYKALKQSEQDDRD